MASEMENCKENDMENKGSSIWKGGYPNLGFCILPEEVASDTSS